MHGDPSPLDETPEAIAAKHRKSWLTLGGVVLALALLLAIYSFLTQPPPLPGTGETLSARQIKDVMTPLVGRLEGAGITGQSQFAGLAVTTGQGEMVTTCHSLPSSGPLQVIFQDGTSRAESARVNRALDVCVLKVQTTGRTSAKLRTGDPANGEKLYVVFIEDAKAAPRLVEARVVNLISEPGGTALKIDVSQKLATGAAVFDTQGRLAGIVTSPHSFGDFPVALSPSRIEQARAAAKKGGLSAQ
ncbi:MAG: trypsin-like peptidase domain-containing protein [Burkholderiales bacterium]|nr:trypsin-like peptidase domain-containing protein [Burkholderiales bacterium]